jgi:class 3 adenylate cyclase
VKCLRCQHENEAAAKFCEECAAPIARLCASCGHPLSPAANYCPECGRPATATMASTVAPRFTAPDAYTPRHLAERMLSSKAAIEGERKQVTVLFADLKGSMELLADRDPEEARRLLDPILEHMIEAVHRYEGTVNQVMGDGIMALFGAPLAHEDHAVRACYAALRMQESVKRYADEIRHSHGVTAKIRVGLNSGEVVVRAIGSDLRMDYSAVGQTTHLAARMEQSASPDHIRLTAATLELVEGFVSVKPLGRVPIKGLADGVEAYELMGAGPARTRLQAAARRGLTRFIGRDRELEVLRRAHRLVSAGHGQVAAIVGEAGVGKSRLAYEFSLSLRSQGWLALESGSASYGKTPSYFPLIELLNSYFKIQDADDPREIREKVSERLLRLDKSLEPMLPALLSLFHVPVDDESWRALDPTRRRERTLDAVKRLLHREAQEHPLLLVFEDLQLIDSETQALLDGLVDSVGSARLLLLVNYRPEYQHAWGGKSYFSQIRLDSLPPENAEQLLDSLLGDASGLVPLKQLLVKRGNPFFLEETVRTLVETKTLVGEPGRYRLMQSVQTLQVPLTVQAVLAARIDRLAVEDKRLLQVASVAGRQVSLALLRAIADLPEEGLRRGLDRLQAAEFVYETGLFPDIEYSFKHALTLEVTYNTLLGKPRRELDARIVQAFELLFPDRATTPIERLAHHAFRGEVWDKALIYCREAAARAFARSTLNEALLHVDQALEALRRLGEGPEQKRQELELVMQRATALRMLHGYAAPEVERVYLRALELCREVPDMPERFGLEWQQMQYFLVRADMDTASKLAHSLLDYATAHEDVPLLIDAHLASGMTAFQVGRFVAARDHLERSVGLCRTELDQPRLATHGQCPGVFSLGYLAWTLWFLGWPERAGACAEEAIKTAKLRAHAFTYVSALMFAVRVHCGRLDMERVKKLAAQITALSREHGFAYYEAQGLINEGWARVLLDDDEGGYGQLQEGCTALERTGTVLGLKGALVKATEVCQRLGRLDDARSTLDRLQHMEEGAGARLWDAEIARLNAEVASHGSDQDPATAAQWFRTAVATARAQGARSLELRAALSYMRVLRRADPGHEARALLAEAVESFTEGVETIELLEARALLNAPD